MQRVLGIVVLCCALVASVAAPAFAEKRIALVIGNSAYANLPADKQLANAVNDARSVKKTLEQALHFQVLYGENLDRRAIVDKLFDLASRLDRDDIVFFYFAGHGVSFSGANYLLPSDIPAPHAGGRAEEARLADQAIAETQVIERITSSGARVAIVVLDACRDNPLRGPDTRALGSTHGLAQKEPPRGVFSIYSAGFFQQALDRLGPDDHDPNSVFTRVFVETLKTPGIGIRTVAIETRRQVVELAAKIGYDQFPAFNDQISDDVYLAGPPAARDKVAVVTPPAQPVPPRPRGPERRIALVLGMSNYQIVAKLPNAKNDAEVLGEALRSAGFASVTILSHITRDQMMSALSTFAVEAAGADWAVVFFGGHGIRLRGEDYIFAVDANLRVDTDVPVIGVTITPLLQSVSAARAVRLVIVDAGRNYVFAGNHNPATEPPLQFIGAPGTLVAYACLPGAVTMDGGAGDNHSPFTAALVSAIGTPRLDIGLLFRKVHDDVVAATKGVQQPVLYGTVPAGNLTFKVLQ